MISPVTGSMVAPSETTGLNAKVPPIVPVIVALLASPSQKSARVKLASSCRYTSTACVLDIGHNPDVKYSTV